MSVFTVTVTPHTVSFNRRAVTCKRVELRSCATPTSDAREGSGHIVMVTREEYAVITISIFRFPPSCSTGRLSSSGSAAFWSGLFLQQLAEVVDRDERARMPIAKGLAPPP